MHISVARVFFDGSKRVPKAAPFAHFSSLRPEPFASISVSRAQSRGESKNTNCTKSTKSPTDEKSPRCSSLRLLARWRRRSRGVGSFVRRFSLQQRMISTAKNYHDASTKLLTLPLAVADPFAGAAALFVAGFFPSSSFSISETSVVIRRPISAGVRDLRNQSNRNDGCSTMSRLMRSAVSSGP